MATIYLQANRCTNNISRIFERNACKYGRDVKIDGGVEEEEAILRNVANRVSMGGSIVIVLLVVVVVVV